MERYEIWEKAMNVWDIESNSISNLKNVINEEVLCSVVKLIANCKGKIITIGLGTSAAAAKKIAHTFSCVNIPSFFLSTVEGAHGGLGTVQKKDIVIALSKGGNTSEILKLLPSIKARQAKLIGISENSESILAKESDIFLKVKVEREACKYNMLATASTASVIAVFDAIAVILMEYSQFSKKEFLINHPGGAVGQMLYEQVSNKK